MEKQKMSLQILFLAILIFFPVVHGSGCRRECGGIDVLYPFGLDDTPECYRDSSFKLLCDDTSTPSRLFEGKLPLHYLSVDDGTAKAELFTSWSCYSASNLRSDPRRVNLRKDGPFTFSSTHNKFSVLGCNALGFISDNENMNFATGCVAMCNQEDIANYNYSNYAKHLNTVTSCLGSGCCQTPIPEGLKTLHTSVQRIIRTGEEFTFDGCSFGLLAGQNELHINQSSEGIVSSLVVFDWAIGNTTYNPATAQCGPGAHPINSSSGIGYKCSCYQGFAGNPYNTSTGCQDIDECLPFNRTNNPCHGRCQNIQGNYICHCLFGYEGDGKINSCTLKTVVKVMIGIGSALVIAALVLPICWMYKKRIQERNHRKNGGLLLGHLSIKIYQESRLQKATNGYESGNLVGEGGNGWVYKGVQDGKEIAVKKSKIVDQDQIKEFLNEVDIVSKINHTNVVKLLGICLETQVPLLVYEFISNGTLYHHLHGRATTILNSWPTCLRIAAETARALDYMHSLANPPIIHRDIKTSNILLDEMYTPKVADFGASKLIPPGQKIAHTRGQGTMGYLDPEYLQTGELTVKSDVYGFGVVLMELLCKQKPLYRGVSGEMISLVQVFTSAVEDDRVDQLLKFGVFDEQEAEQIYIVADLAMKCVRMRSKDRPTMTEVADVLNAMSKVYLGFQVQGSSNSIEVVGLLDDQDVITTSVDFDLE